MTDCTREPLLFASVERRQIVADFAGGDLTSDGGLPLLREVDQRIGLIDSLNGAICDPRFQPLVTHDQRTILAQRIFALAAGYEDLNDHHSLRKDTLLQAMTDRRLKCHQEECDPLSSPPTLCRLENRVTRGDLTRMSKVLVDVFIASHTTPPEELVLDFDATDDAVHGNHNTADNTGDAFSILWPYGDYAGLDPAELEFIYSQLLANQGARLTLAFGHHPLAATGNAQDTYLYYGKDQFVGYLNTYGASLYGYGHTHASSESFYTANMTEGVFYFNVSSLGKGDLKHYTLTAIDCDGIASVTQPVGTWPVVLITAPMDKTLGKNVNPYTYTVTNSTNNPIRALVFDTGAVSQVQYRIDMAGSWYPMARTAGTNYPHLWEGTWNASALASGEHTIEVQASTASGVRTDSVKVNMQSTQTQPKAGIASMITGKYAKRSTSFTQTSTFVPGDAIVFRATIKNSSGVPVQNATASIAVTGPTTMTILTGPSDANGISEGIWKTSAPSRKSAGTPTGTTYMGTVKEVTASGYVWDAIPTSKTFAIQ